MTDLAGEVVSLRGLSEDEHGKVLCYPRCEQGELERRVKELEGVVVEALEFTGEWSVFGLPVLGKGCVGIVVVAHTSSGRVALKIRRTDADRKEMFHEAEMLQKANTLNVGPKLLKVTENFLLMELIKGKHFPEWLKTLEPENEQTRVRLVLRQVLEQCYRLDEAGLDHGELSNAYKHIIVDTNDKPNLIDFETASTNRRPSNVTAVSQYLLLGSKIANTTKQKLKKTNKKQLIAALRNYKQEPTRNNFEQILQTIL